MSGQIRVTKDPDWQKPTLGRSCGECYACCVWLGIVELKKYTGQSCKKLSGVDPQKRCSIYSTRPTACQSYRCFWLLGAGGEQLRPDKSGFLMTAYDSMHPGLDTSVTVMVFDEEKAKPHLETVIEQLILLGVNDLRVVNHYRKTGLYYLKGRIYKCEIIPPSKGDYEQLSFATDLEKPVGTYYFKDEGETAP